MNSYPLINPIAIEIGPFAVHWYGLMYLFGISLAYFFSCSFFEKTLKLTGVGFRANLKGKQLNLQLGFSHDINYDIPEGITVKVEKQTTIIVSGVDKELVGKVVADLKFFKPVEPYKQKGITSNDQFILKKEGKKK